MKSLSKLFVISPDIPTQNLQSWSESSQGLFSALVPDNRHFILVCIPAPYAKRWESWKAEPQACQASCPVRWPAPSESITCRCSRCSDMCSVGHEGAEGISGCRLLVGSALQQTSRAHVSRPAFGRFHRRRCQGNIMVQTLQHHPTNRLSIMIAP